MCQLAAVNWLTNKPEDIIFYFGGWSLRLVLDVWMCLILDLYHGTLRTLFVIS